MDRINFKQLDQYLKAEIQGGSSLQKNDLFGIVLGKISVYACRILNLRNVAYRNILRGEIADERNEYFSSIEGILALLYADFPNLKFESRVKLYMTKLITPKSGVERSEVIQKLQSYLPKLETSWVDVAWVWNPWVISWRSYRFASFFIFKKSDFLNFILDFSLVIFISYQRYFLLLWNFVNENFKVVWY